MAVTMAKCEDAVGSPPLCFGEYTCSQLRCGEESEALRFLAERPVHTVYMATLIRDNGLENQLNRGSFYAWRNDTQKIEGIALIGHVTIVEARTEQAVAAFAKLAARNHPYLIRGERKTVETFWHHYSQPGQNLRLISREMLFEKTKSTPAFEPINDLRPATLDELEHVLEINAILAFEDGGVNPFQRDPAGFRARTSRRIQQGRVWICMLDGRPVFKADLVGDTPEMIYLEGVHVDSRERNKGYGQRCLLELSSILLRRSQSICLTINQRKADASAFYVKAGFDFHSEYQTIYLR